MSILLYGLDNCPWKAAIQNFSTTSSNLLKFANADDWDIDIATCKQIANTTYDQEIEGLELTDELTRMIEQYPKDSLTFFQGFKNANPTIHDIETLGPNVKLHDEILRTMLEQN